ncbi:MAG: hypothetical protein ABIQ31_01805 [Ferruginibacter sp.]
MSSVNQSFDGLEYNDDFEDLILSIIKKIRTKIAQDIKLLFPSEELQLRLFGAIFNMNETKGYVPSRDDYHLFFTIILLLNGYVFFILEKSIPIIKYDLKPSS